jgi:hypothetical protein
MISLPRSLLSASILWLALVRMPQGFYRLRRCWIVIYPWAYSAAEVVERAVCHLSLLTSLLWSHLAETRNPPDCLAVDPHEHLAVGPHDRLECLVDPPDCLVDCLDHLVVDRLDLVDPQPHRKVFFLFDEEVLLVNAVRRAC